MKWVTSNGKTLYVQEKGCNATSHTVPGFIGSITPHAVHELLFDPAVGDVPPLFPALTAARAVVKESASRTLVWIDPARTFYPPAAMRSTISSLQLDVLRPGPSDLIWAAVECLRSKQVGVVVALLMHRLTRVEVRRLQLAAEYGGGVGVLLRPNLPSSGSNIYAAATRWLVSSTPGERTIQRWRIQQVHGQGRRTHSPFLLEKDRVSGQAHFVYPSPSVARHPVLPTAS